MLRDIASRGVFEMVSIACAVITIVLWWVDVRPLLLVVFTSIWVVIATVLGCATALSVLQLLIWFLR